MHHPTTPSIDHDVIRRTAGAAALVFVLCFVLAVLLSGPPVVHEGQAGLEHSLSARPLPWVLASLATMSAGLVALLVTVAYLVQALGRRTAGGALSAQVAWAGGLGYVMVLLGVALPAGAAAAWSLHQGGDLGTALVLNNVRNFAYLAILPLMGVTALGLGLAALTDRELTRVVGWGGVTVGGLSLLALPAAAVGISYAMPLWLLWWTGVGLSLLRRGGPWSSHLQRPAPQAMSGTLEQR